MRIATKIDCRNCLLGGASGASGIRRRLGVRYLPIQAILLSLVFLFGSGESRFAYGAENEEPAKKSAESELIPLSQESAVFNEGAPSPARNARPHGLNDALSMPVGIDLPALDSETINAMRMEYGPTWIGPYRTLQQMTRQPSMQSESMVQELPGIWGFTPDNEPIWRLTIRSAEAASIRIRFEAFDVAGEVWVYSNSGESYAGPYSGRGPRGAGAFWSDPIPSDTVTVEYFPHQRGVTEMRPPFRIPKISHEVQFERSKTDSHLGRRRLLESAPTRRNSDIPGPGERSSASPYKDATCSLNWLQRGDGDGQRTLVDSVAMLQTPTENGFHGCSGFLVNALEERDDTGLPSYYVGFFTNNHCVENQRQAIGTDLYWKFRTATCDGLAPAVNSVDVTRGARLWDTKYEEGRFRNGWTRDYTLLLVHRDELPRGVRFAGWTTADVVRGEDVYTLGHPDEQPLRLAVGDVDDPDHGVIWPFSSPAFGVSSDYGNIGPGASGSPVFSRFGEDGKVVGVLTATTGETFYQGEEWHVHKFSDIHDDFRHLRNIERETQRISLRLGGETYWFTFFESNFLDGWVLNNKFVVESGDRVSMAGTDFVVELRNGEWNVRAIEGDHAGGGSGSGGSSLGTATVLAVGSSVEGYLSAGEVDHYRFEVGAATRVAVYTTGPTDTFGALNGSASNDDGGENLNFRIEASIPAGSHFVEVSGYDELVTGNYTLHVRTVSGGGSGDSGGSSAAPGLITTVAGTGAEGFSGDGGPATRAQLAYPRGLAVDSAGDLYIADVGNHRVRKVDVRTGLITTVAGTGAEGFSGDGGPATRAQLAYPRGLAVDSAGDLYIADVGNHRVRKVDGRTGRITTVAGTGTEGFSGDGGPATRAQLGYLDGLAVDSTGNLYIADAGFFRVRKVDGRTGLITTVVEQVVPAGLAVDSAGNLYIGDSGLFRVHKLDVRTEFITTVAERVAPLGLAVDSAGNLYFTDVNNQNRQVQKVDVRTGRITPVAGTGTEGFSGDGGPATRAQLAYPRGLAVDGAGNLYIADGLRVRMVSRVAVPVAGGSGTGGEGGAGNSSRLSINDMTGFTRFGVRVTVDSDASSHEGIRDIQSYFENLVADQSGFLPYNILAYYRGKIVGVGQVQNGEPIEIRGDALVTAIWNFDSNHTQLRLDLSGLRMSGLGDSFRRVLAIGNQVTAVERIRFPNVTLRGVETFSYADWEPWDRSNRSWAYDVEGRYWVPFSVNASFQGQFGGWNEGAPSQVSGTWTLENPDHASDGVYVRYTGAFVADQYHTQFGGGIERLGNDPGRTAPPPP